MKKSLLAFCLLSGTASLACPLGSNFLPPGEVLESGCTIISGGNGQNGVTSPFVPGATFCPQWVMSGSSSCYFVKKCVIPGVDYCFRRTYHTNGVVQQSMNAPLICPSGYAKVIDRTGAMDKCMLKQVESKGSMPSN
ncbi:MAG: hypothetical protein KGP28_06535 [Bdellovibrionales bacterium]|nr:hypothetical protein [Bdellovibrionales bacterium]